MERSSRSRTADRTSVTTAKSSKAGKSCKKLIQNKHFAAAAGTVAGTHDGNNHTQEESCSNSVHIGEDLHSDAKFSLVHAKMSDANDFLAYPDELVVLAHYSLNVAQIRSLVENLFLEDLIVCTILGSNFASLIERVIYTRYISAFCKSRYAVCLECCWSYNESRVLHDSQTTLSFVSAAPRSPSNKRIAEKFLRGLGDYQLQLAQKRVNAYQQAVDSTASPLPITSIELYFGEAYSICATSFAAIDWAVLLASVFSIAKPSLKSLTVCHGFDSKAATFTSLQLHAIDEALSQPGGYPRLTYLHMPSSYFNRMSEAAARRLARSVEILNMSSCGWTSKCGSAGGSQNCFVRPIRLYDEDGNERDTRYKQFKRVHTLCLNAAAYGDEGFELPPVHDGMNSLYSSLPNVRAVILELCNYISGPLPDTPSARAGQFPWIGGPPHDFNSERRQLIPKIKTLDISLLPDDYDEEDDSAESLPENVLSLSRQITVIDEPFEFSRNNGSKYAHCRDNYAAYFAPLHKLHCSQQYSNDNAVSSMPSSSSTPATLSSCCLDEKLLWPRICFDIKLDNADSMREQLNDAEYSSKVKQLHKQTTDWLGRFELLCTCEYKTVFPRYLGAAAVCSKKPNESDRATLESDSRICGGVKQHLAAERAERNGRKTSRGGPELRNSLNPPLPAKSTCKLQVSRLTIRFSGFDISNTNELQFYREIILKPVLWALAGMPSSFVTPWPNSASFKEKNSDNGKKNRKNGNTTANDMSIRRNQKMQRQVFGPNRKVFPATLPTPLLHVRSIMLHCQMSTKIAEFFDGGNEMDADIEHFDEEFDEYGNSRTDLYGHYEVDDDESLAKLEADEDDDATAANAKPVLRSRRFELMSKAFQRDLMPLIRLIAERFVQLRYFSVICDWNGRKVVYNLDSAVLAERVDGRFGDE